MFYPSSSKRLVFMVFLLIGLISGGLPIIGANEASEEFVLDYTVSIHEPASGSAHINVKMQNLQGDAIILSFPTNAAAWSGNWLAPENNVSDIQARDASGAPLSIKTVDDGIPWTGDGIQICTGGSSEVTLEYNIRFGFRDPNFYGGERIVGGYLNTDFAVAEPEFLFYTPVHVPWQMRVTFEVPPNWECAAHWEKIGQCTYRAETREWPLYANGAILLGHILIDERNFNGTRFVIAAYGMDDVTFYDAVTKTLQLYGYFNTVVGAHPTRGYILAFVPSVVDGKYVEPYNENLGGYFAPYQGSYEYYWVDWIAHPVLHNWNGGVLQGTPWFQEGFTNYYELKACQETSIYSPEHITANLRSRVERYRNEILGTPNDISLHEASQIFGYNHNFPYNWLVYEKGSLVAYLFDYIIARKTDGARDLDDVMRFLFENYGLKNRPLHNTADFISPFSTASGFDFSPLFDAYVYGTEELPLYIQDNQVIVDESRIPLLNLTNRVYLPLVRKSPATSPATISGRVLKNGAPIAGRWIHLVVDPGTSREKETAAVETDVMGRFSFPAEPGANYEIRGFGEMENDELQEWCIHARPTSSTPNLVLPDIDIYHSGLLSPVDGVAFASISPTRPITFQWSPKTGSTGYQVWIRELNNWSNPRWHSEVTGNTTALFDGTLADGSHIGPGWYAWHVGTELNSGWWVWSEWHVLQIVECP